MRLKFIGAGSGPGVQFWSAIVVGTLITGVLALGAHDLAIAVLGVPYPDEASVPQWARFAKYVLSMTAAVLLCLAAWPMLSRWRIVAATGIVGLVLLAFNEVARNIVIEWVISDGWTGTNGIYILTKHMPRSLSYLYQAIAALVIVRFLVPRRKGWAVAAVIVASVAGFYLLLPALKSSTSIIREALNVSTPVDLYQPPWPLDVYAYIYGMYIEPAIATILLAAACWPRLGNSIAVRLASFTALILLLRGDVVTTFVYPAWSGQPLPLAIASEAQFLVQGSLLALLAAATWQIATRASAAPLAR